MSKVESGTNTRLVLTKDEVRQLWDAIKDLNAAHWWIRLVVITEAVEEVDETAIAYLQGADGEEATVWEYQH